MKKILKATIVLAVIGCSSLATFSVPASAASGNITTAPTGYTSADDVVYKKAGNYVKNWGARGEDCVFLSEYAEDFYAGNGAYAILSQKQGGTTQSDAANSPLYGALAKIMADNHSYKTSYDGTKGLYQYTDCVRSDSTKISSFYSGTVLNGNWGSSPSWNREHTWPKSKGNKGNDATDIMMLRPTASSENGSRSNYPYGEGDGFYDPNVKELGDKNARGVRGDCARIMLYSYTRWGLADKMWQPAGKYPTTEDKSGVMENLDILLKWMEEDPVDTWEMGRNDAVQSITGTRNIFVDYPEYAWLLFGEEIPDDMTTPSGIAKKGGENGSVEDSSFEDSVGSSANQESSVESSSVEDSSFEDSVGSSANQESSVESSFGGESATEDGQSEENSKGAGFDIGGLLAGCQGSLGGVASGVVLAIVGGCALKKRKFK